MLRRLAFLLTAAVLALGACSSSPAAPAISDPKEILTKSVELLKDVKTFHFQADVTGSVNMDLTGQGSGGSLDLKGTTAQGDIDIANKKFHASLSALFGLSADLIVIDQDSYVKLSPFTDKYEKTTSTGSSTDPASDPNKAIDEISSFLDQPGVAPTKQADEKCGDKDCYHITLTLTSDQINSAASGVLGSNVPTGSGTVDVWVEKDTLHPAKLTITATSADQGDVAITVTISNYDAAVTITAPPESEIGPAPSL